MMPIFAGSSQSAHLDTEDQTNVIEADFREQSLETEPPFRCTAAFPLVVINNEHAVSWPTQFNRPVDQSVLSFSGFAVFKDLLR